MLRASRAAALGRKALDVDDQLQQAVLADLALEDRHDVAIVALDDLGVRIQNRFANVGLVGDHGAAVVQLAPDGRTHCAARAAALCVGNVAGHAAILLKQLFTLVRHGPAACRPPASLRNHAGSITVTQPPMSE